MGRVIVAVQTFYSTVRDYLDELNSGYQSMGGERTTGRCFIVRTVSLCFCAVLCFFCPCFCLGGCFVAIEPATRREFFISYIG